MKYIVLRADAQLDTSADFTKVRGWRQATDGISEVKLEIADVSASKVGDLRADPHHLAVMPAEAKLTLIRPLATQSGSDTPLTFAGAQYTTPGVIAVGAHTSPYNGQGVTVAVLDTGIDKDHPAFAGKELATYDFSGSGTSQTDVNDHDGHGTHCAATVCATVVDNVRVGVAPGVTKLCVGKVLNDDGGGTLDMMMRGMMWAVQHENAAVVSMSLGYDLPGNQKLMMDHHGMPPEVATNHVLRQQADIINGVARLRAYLEWKSPNVIFVAATGNESQRPMFALDAGLPATELTAVGAVGRSPDQDGWSVAPFSNGRAKLVAPGVDVMSAAIGGGWKSLSGTSMATPHAAGVAALWVQKLRAQGAAQVPAVVNAELLASARTDMLAGGDDRDAVGSGMVQAPQ